MKEALKLLLILSLAIFIPTACVGGVVYYNVKVWYECRADNSVLYCIKVLS